MTELRAVDLGRITQMLGTSAKPVSILWQTPGSVAFVARGREHRSEFHVDPSDEVMYMLKGDMELHYLTDTGEERVVLIREGEILHCPAGTPHSPRFAPDAYVLVLERTRRPDEHDRFHWYCRACGARLYEAVRQVGDYREDPVSRVYEEFYGSESHRTCARCGDVMPAPSGEAPYIGGASGFSSG
ncbi:MAG: 3-hydroxybutyryl-CoA dehydratase [Candidatus Rokuibacteriota bacterium]|nr:MAG: 3-hydroxybutyryl-CoA dehydratase [Candidatus Rokubacteria bacterium]PYN60845.1 MAG: 3-hydroxybutyryl-CoA dehydratase [Candidatus Rokubacteria bacterium]